MAWRPEFVHIVNRATGESVKIVGPCANANRTATGVSINLNHDEYAWIVSPCGHTVMNPLLCFQCLLEPS